jgi:putative transposase
MIAPRSPWQNLYGERLIGSNRRECLDHVMVLHEQHLKRILTSYFCMCFILVRSKYWNALFP